MKNLILAIIFMALTIPCAMARDVIPATVFGENNQSWGVYQISAKSVNLYEEPDEASKEIKRLFWDDENTSDVDIDLADLFVLYLPARDLALFEVADETEDWVKIIYNRKTGDAAWLKKDDPLKFMTWGMFYNTYGRKYGLYQLKEAPKLSGILRASTDDYAQTVGELNMPKKINLTVIKGNWALVSVSDLDKYPKTGYVRWRGNNGEKYYFPKIKTITGVN